MKKFGILLLSLTVLLMTSGAYAADSNLKLSDNTIGVGDEFVVLDDNSGSTGYEWWLRGSTEGLC